MRILAMLMTAGAICVMTVAVDAGAERGPALRHASLHTRLVPSVALSYPAPRPTRYADVDLRGTLPEGFAPDPSAAPIAIQVELNGVTIWGGEDDAMLVAPKRRAMRWGPAPSDDPDWTVEYARCLRATLDLRRGSFHFRMRFVDHAVMEGRATAVPYVIRIGEEEISGTINFDVSRRNLWRTR